MHTFLHKETSFSMHLTIMCQETSSLAVVLQNAAGPLKTLKCNRNLSKDLQIPLCLEVGELKALPKMHSYYPHCFASGSLNPK